jgi:hypothetical protein
MSVYFDLYLGFEKYKSITRRQKKYILRKPKKGIAKSCKRVYNTLVIKKGGDLPPKERMDTMKFYYNGKLVRTSKNHEYTHACMANDICKGCRTNAKAAQQIKDGKIAELTRTCNAYATAIKALNEGKSYYINREDRRAYRVSLEGRTVEFYEEHIAWVKRDIEWIKHNWKVVELEAREW